MTNASFVFQSWKQKVVRPMDIYNDYYSPRLRLSHLYLITRQRFLV